MNLDAAAGKFLMFLQLNPGMGLFVLAVGITMSRKFYKHRKGEARITWKTLKRYPAEALEMGMVVLALLLSAVFFLMG